MSWQQPRFTKKTSHRPIGPSFESVNHIISSGNNNIISNKDKDEKLDFCPHCGGMMLQSEEGLKCGSCYYVKEGTKIIRKKPQAQINKEKVENELKNIDLEILRNVYKKYFKYSNKGKNAMISQLSQKNYKVVHSAVVKETNRLNQQKKKQKAGTKANRLNDIEKGKQILRDCSPDAFDRLCKKLSVPRKYSTKEEKIEFLAKKYPTKRLQNELYT